MKEVGEERRREATYQLLDPIPDDRPLILITPAPLVIVPIELLKVLAPARVEEHHRVLQHLVLVCAWVGVGEVLEEVRGDGGVGLQFGVVECVGGEFAYLAVHSVV